MRRLRFLILFLICMPVMPDLSCTPLLANDSQITAPNSDGVFAAILFFLAMLVGCRLWRMFMRCFEKGSF